MAKGAIKFNIEECKGCGVCAVSCPFSVIEMNSEVINTEGFHPAFAAHPEKCTGCTSCALMCPDRVITVFREER